MGVNFAATCASCGFLNYFGRRTLNLSMTAACAVYLLIEALSSIYNLDTLTLIMCLCFVCAFEFGPGPVVWMYMSEVMNDSGVSSGVFINWFLTLVIGLGSAQLEKKIGGNIFFIFFGF